MLRERSVNLGSLREGISVNSPSGRLQAALLSAMATTRGSSFPKGRRRLRRRRPIAAGISVGPRPRLMLTLLGALRIMQRTFRISALLLGPASVLLLILSTSHTEA